MPLVSISATSAASAADFIQSMKGVAQLAAAIRIHNKEVS